MTSPARTGEPDIARVASLFANGTRARILMALAGGRSLPASVLADHAGVTPQAASTQLNRLRGAGLITVRQSGRNRYYELADHRIAELMERLAALAPAQPVAPTLRAGNRNEALRRARVCYDHAAGRLGVAITDALLNAGALAPVGGTPQPADAEHPYRLGPAAIPVLTSLGIPESHLADDQRRPLLRFCLDWTEQRHHLAGRLGADLLTAFTTAGWVTLTPTTRALRLTPSGEEALTRRLGMRDADGTAFGRPWPAGQVPSKHLADSAGKSAAQADQPGRCSHSAPADQPSCERPRQDSNLRPSA